jgi:G3E family GTPase
MRDPLGRIPVTIVTGFLGSGKTTLLNHLLTAGELGRAAALVNDFGAIDIDAALVASLADEVVQLANGCICCTINGDLLNAVERVLAIQPAFDYILVETTGLADPLPVGLTFLQTDLRKRTALQAVVTVVDCANFALDLFKADAAMAQIVHADVVVFNKTDMVMADDVASLERRIGLIKPRAKTLTASYGRVPIAALVEIAGELSLSDHAGHSGHAHSHLRTDGFEAHAFHFDGPLSARALQAFIDDGLPQGLFRAKGIFGLDSPSARYVFQLCGGRVAFEPYHGDVVDARLVFIGQNIDGSLLRERIEACRLRQSAYA